MPECGEDEVLIAVKCCGICGSDIPRVYEKGKYHFPTVIGHEFSGQVAYDPQNTLTEKAAAMKQTIQELSYNGEFFEDNVRRDENNVLQKAGHTTETCQYYAFYFGIATPESYPELWQKLCSQFGPRRDKEAVYPLVYPSNAIVGNYLRLELLLEQGCTEQVLQECKDFFTQMAQLTGTLWEHSRLSASLNHGFASIAALYIHQCINAQ